MTTSFAVSDKALKASLHVAKLITRQNKPHTIGETLINPVCKEIVRVMLGDMSSDVLETLIIKLKTAIKFSLQLNESTDIKNR